MNEKLKNYLLQELKVSEALLPDIVAKIEKYDDIRSEFYRWLDLRNYDFEQPVTVENYTARQIYNLCPKLDGIGVYNFLITLREHPDRAKQYIAEGFEGI